MGASLSVEEKVHKCAKDGDAAQLQSILQQVQRQGGQLRKLLEAADYAGNTPLLVAAAAGNTPCADVLLRAGASPHHFSQRPEGSTALHEAVGRGHAAVCDLLLRYGANPFIENARGLTAVDVAINRGNVPLVRMLERLSHFCGTLQLKVPKFMGLGSEWKPRWAVVMPRYSFPCERTPAEDLVARCLLVCYKGPDQCVPACKVWLDGAVARAVTGSRGSGLLQCALALHRNHALATGALMTGDSSTGYTLHLRPADGSPQGSTGLRRFMEIVNSIGRPAQPAAAAAAQPAAPAQPPAAAAAAPAAAPAAAAAARPGPSHVRAGDSDEDIARRLQQQYDAEAAAYARANPQQAQAAGKLGGGGGSGSRLSNVHQPSPAASAGLASRPSAPLYPPIDPTAAAPQASGAGPSAPAQWGSLPAATAPPPAPAQGGGSAAPLAPSHPSGRVRPQDSPAITPPAAASAADEDADAGLCVICLAEPSTAGFVHGDSVHKCCCRECALDLKRAQQADCPMCRQPIQHVLFNFY